MGNFVIRMHKFIIAIMHIFESGFALIGLLLFQISMFFFPIKFNIYLVGALITVDVITALIALFMQSKKESSSLRESFSRFYSQWTSKRAFDSIPKFVWYSMLVLLGFMIGYIIGEPAKVANLATGFIAYVEVRSIIENGDKAFGTNIWELIVDSVKDFFKPKT